MMRVLNPVSNVDEKKVAVCRTVLCLYQSHKKNYRIYKNSKQTILICTLVGWLELDRGDYIIADRLVNRKSKNAKNIRNIA